MGSLALPPSTDGSTRRKIGPYRVRRESSAVGRRQRTHSLPQMVL